MATKSFKNKLKSLMAKGGLNSSVLFLSYDKRMSQLLPENRYWMLVFAREIGYSPQKGDPIWLAMIKVWDTEIEDWVNTIHLNYYLTASHSCMHYDHEHQLIMFATRGTIQHRVYIYSFLSEKVIVNPIIARADKNPDPINWRIVNDSLLFHDEMHWQEYSLSDLKSPTETKKRYMYDVADSIIGQGLIESFYAVEEIIHPHPRVNVMIVRSEFHRDIKTAIVFGSTNTKLPGSLPQIISMPVTLAGGMRTEITINEQKMLTIGKNSIDVAEFIV